MTTNVAWLSWLDVFPSPETMPVITETTLYLLNEIEKVPDLHAACQQQAVEMLRQFPPRQWIRDVNVIRHEARANLASALQPLIEDSPHDNVQSQLVSGVSYYDVATEYLADALFEIVPPEPLEPQDSNAEQG